jgi:hypothetical protein
MGFENFDSEDADVEIGLEQKVRRELEENGYDARKDQVQGISGNTWELDAIALSEDGSPVAYFEIKDTSEDAAKQTYRNHMIRAAAELMDFRDEDIPGAVVVPKKRDFGNKDWDALFNSIGCELIEEKDLSEFINGI